MTAWVTTTVRAGAVAGLFLLLGCAAPVTVSAQPYTIQGERAAHPRMAHALDNMYAALRELEAAPDVFGGHKAEAIADLRRAIHSTKRALYFRLKMDDRALEGVQ